MFTTYAMLTQLGQVIVNERVARQRQECVVPVETRLRLPFARIGRALVRVGERMQAARSPQTDIADIEAFAEAPRSVMVRRAAKSQGWLFAWSAMRRRCAARLDTRDLYP